jgi:hypothetical protein
MTPDPRRDVMVYQMTMVDALAGGAIGERWSVWTGEESEGSFESEAEAIAEARRLADEHGRPAWLVLDGRAAVPLP